MLVNLVKLRFHFWIVPVEMLSTSSTDVWKLKRLVPNFLEKPKFEFAKKECNKLYGIKEDFFSSNPWQIVDA